MIHPLEVCVVEDEMEIYAREDCVVEDEMEICPPEREYSRGWMENLSTRGVHSSG